MVFQLADSSIGVSACSALADPCRRKHLSFLPAARQIAMPARLPFSSLDRIYLSRLRLDARDASVAPRKSRGSFRTQSAIAAGVAVSAFAFYLFIQSDEWPPTQQNTLAPKYIYTIFGVILFFWIFRNTPLYPFVTREGKRGRGNRGKRKDEEVLGNGKGHCESEAQETSNEKTNSEHYSLWSYCLRTTFTEAQHTSQFQKTLFITLLFPSSPFSPLPLQTRPVHTFSIVARDPATGELGVAVQSHWFSVGPIVAWAEAGVGAIATQSFVDPSYGKLGLDLMRAGKSAPDTLKALLAGDEGREVRQVAMIDSQGRVEAWTGKNDIQAAGHIVGKNYSVQANLMLNDKVWPAMSAAFENAKGDLAERMLAALDAAQAAGGDIRGKQSAALIVVTGKPTGQAWKDRIFDLRVDDSSDPLGELRRLVKLAARIQPHERRRSGSRTQRQ